jgi:hypothetical protein
MAAIPVVESVLQCRYTMTHPTLSSTSGIVKCPLRTKIPSSVLSNIKWPYQVWCPVPTSRTRTPDPHESGTSPLEQSLMSDLHVSPGLHSLTPWKTSLQKFPVSLQPAPHVAAPYFLENLDCQIPIQYLPQSLSLLGRSLARSTQPVAPFSHSFTQLLSRALSDQIHRYSLHGPDTNKKNPLPCMYVSKLKLHLHKTSFSPFPNHH